MPPAKSIYAANCHLRWALRVYLTAQYTHSHIHAHTHTRTHTSTSKHTSTSTLNHKHVTARPHARLQHSIVISPYGHSTARGSAARHGIAPHCTVPHCTTPHHTALYHTTPHHTTPHHTAPHHPSISSPHLAPYRVSRHLLPCCLRRPSNGSTRRLKMSHSSAAAALLISYGTRRSRCLLCECCVVESHFAPLPVPPHSTTTHRDSVHLISSHPTACHPAVSHPTICRDTPHHLAVLQLGGGQGPVSSVRSHLGGGKRTLYGCACLGSSGGRHG